jgi:hypothetical protein
MKRLAAVVGLSILTLGAASWGQAPTPKGDQFQINTYTTSNQGNPSVAVDPLGNFVVVWQSTGSFGNDSLSNSIQAQRYDANGAPAGDQFQVNTYTTYSQDTADIAMDGQGNFVVVWESSGSAGSDTSDESILGQRFASDGTPVGAEFQINTYTTDEQSKPVVAMDSLGNFVVVWESYGSNGTDSDYNSIQGQLFDSDGDPVGGEFQVNTVTSSRQEDVAVTADGQGNFIVVWESQFVDIKGQIYDDSGAAVGGEFRVDSSGYGNRPAVAADSTGNFTVAWQAEDVGGADMSRTSIEAQRFDSSGNTVGGQFQVNTYTTEWQEDSTIAMDPQGNIIIVWESDGSSGTDTDGYSLQAQYFDSSGTPVGSEFQVNSYMTGDQDNPVVATDGQGDFVVVWNSSNSPTDFSSRSVHGRRYSAGAEVVFSDGFESGDTTGWTSTTQ